MPTATAFPTSGPTALATPMLPQNLLICSRRSGDVGLHHRDAEDLVQAGPGARLLDRLGQVPGDDPGGVRLEDDLAQVVVRGVDGQFQVRRVVQGPEAVGPERHGEFVGRDGQHRAHSLRGEGPGQERGALNSQDNLRFGLLQKSIDVGPQLGERLLFPCREFGQRRLVADAGQVAVLLPTEGVRNAITEVPDTFNCRAVKLSATGKTRRSFGPGKSHGPLKMSS